jgi:hypothetical protein
MTTMTGFIGLLNRLNIHRFTAAVLPHLPNGLSANQTDTHQLYTLYVL